MLASDVDDIWACSWAIQFPTITGLVNTEIRMPCVEEPLTVGIKTLVGSFTSLHKLFRWWPDEAYHPRKVPEGIVLALFIKDISE